MEKDTILVVEDDERFRKMLSFLFVAKGFNVETVRNGLEAWHYLEENTPVLIILDLVMPEMDGFVLFNKIKEVKPLKEVPVIILSGLPYNEIVEKLDAAELTRYLRKPFRTADILTLAADAFKSRADEPAGNQHNLQSGVFNKSE